MSAQPIHKQNQFKSIAKQGIWYLIASLLTKAVSLLLLPVYTRYLSPEDYGILGSLEAVSRFLPVVLSLGLDGAFVRFYYGARRESDEAVQLLFSTLYWSLIGWGLLASCTVLLLAPTMLAPQLSVPYWPYIPLTVMAPLLGQLAIIGASYQSANLRARDVSAVETTGFLLNVGSSVALLVLVKAGAPSKLWGTVIGALASAIIYSYLAVRSGLLRLRFSRAALLQCLGYSLPLVPAVAASWISQISDRLILARYGPMSEVGLYSLSVQVAYLLYLVQDAISKVQMPIGFSALTEDPEKGKKLAADFLVAYAVIIGGAFLSLSLFAREFLMVFTEQRYHSAYALVGILAAPYFISGFYRPFLPILQNRNKNWIIAAAAFLAAGANAGLNLWLIPQYGKIVAALTTLLSALVYTLWIVSWSQAVDRMRVRSFLIGCVLVTAFGLAGVGYLLDQLYADWTLSLGAAKAAVLMGYAGLTCLSPTLRRAYLKVGRTLRQKFLPA